MSDQLESRLMVWVNFLHASFQNWLDLCQIFATADFFPFLKLFPAAGFCTLLAPRKVDTPVFLFHGNLLIFFPVSHFIYIIAARKPSSTARWFWALTLEQGSLTSDLGNLRSSPGLQNTSKCIHRCFFFYRAHGATPAHNRVTQSKLLKGPVPAFLLPGSISQGLYKRYWWKWRGAGEF